MDCLLMLVLLFLMALGALIGATIDLLAVLVIGVIFFGGLLLGLHHIVEGKVADKVFGAVLIFLMIILAIASVVRTEATISIVEYLVRSDWKVKLLILGTAIAGIMFALMGPSVGWWEIKTSLPQARVMFEYLRLYGAVRRLLKRQVTQSRMWEWPGFERGKHGLFRREWTINPPSMFGYVCVSIYPGGDFDEYFRWGCYDKDYDKIFEETSLRTLMKPQFVVRGLRPSKRMELNLQTLEQYIKEELSSIRQHIEEKSSQS
jgi:hypothetical protein